MQEFMFCAGVGLAIFLCGLLGFWLKYALPEHFHTGLSKDLIGLVAGMFSLLSALVMGLLIWTAYGIYSSQNTAIQTFAVRVLQLDRALAEYGPAAGPGRAEMRRDLEKSLQVFSFARESDQQFALEGFNDAVEALSHKAAYIGALNPANDKEKQALAAASQAMDGLVQSRLQMSLALVDPVSYPLILFVAAWVAMLFCAYGLMSATNGMSVVVFGFGAGAIASAIYVILDLSSPYTGIFRPSALPLEKVLAEIARSQAGMIR